VHHTSYRHWRHEPLFELVGVCTECHTEITWMDRRKRACCARFWLSTHTNEQLQTMLTWAPSVYRSTVVQETAHLPLKCRAHDVDG
jgi:hypothetical protein